MRANRVRMLELLAPAKINVTLEILARRDDGYHTLRSVMLPIGLYDRIVLEESEVAQFAVGAGDASLALDNLVARALAACGASRPYAVTLEKRVPVGGGLGGGSSDAAAVIEAAMAGRIVVDGSRDWLAIARGLGSDVTFFLAGTGALVEGVGERVTPIGALPPWWCVVVRPHAAVPTGPAYRALDDARASLPQPSRPRSESASLRAVDALQRADLAALQDALVNDFHDVVLRAYPPVARAHAAFVAAGAPHAMLSGSGSCLFAIFGEEPMSRRVAAAIDPAAYDFLAVVPFYQSGRWRASGSPQ